VSAQVTPLARRTWLPEVSAVALIAIATILGFSRFDSTIYNNYVRLADAFLHGHVWIRWPGDFIDALPRDGKYYVIEGPVPALLILPAVAVFGRAANQTAFACVAAGLAVASGWYIARKLGASSSAAALFSAFLLFGTDLLWCAAYGAVWFTAHVVAMLFALLAVGELLGARRPWMIALLLVLAAGSRFTLAPALLPLLGYAFWKLPPAQRPAQIAGVAVVLACAGALFVAYNYARWGVPNDIGYVTWYHQDPIGLPDGSPFRIEYFPYEFEAFFLSFPSAVSHYPWLIPRYDAVALEFTSPALVLAFFARGERGFLVTMWAATMLVALPSFTYYANGGTQFGMRHALDFIPFMFPLMVLGSRRVSWISTGVLCGLSIAVGLWGFWYWRTFYDQFLVHKLPALYM